MKSWLLHNLAAKYQPAPLQVHVYISNLPKPYLLSLFLVSNFTGASRSGRF